LREVEDATLSTEDALIRYGQLARERAELKRSEQALRERSQCRFRPDISKSSKHMTAMQAIYANGYESDGVIQEQEGRNRSK
jgi:hypothetical protein